MLPRNRLIHPHGIVIVPDGRVLMTRLKYSNGFGQWAVTFNSVINSSEKMAMKEVLEMFSTRFGVPLKETDVFGLTISKMKHLMYVDKIIIPFIIRIKKSIAFEIEDSHYDCTTEHYSEIVSRAVKSLCIGKHENYEDQINEISARVLREVDRVGGIR